MRALWRSQAVSEWNRGRSFSISWIRTAPPPKAPIAIARRRAGAPRSSRKLVFFFAGRRCANPEDLAMETVLRVAAKCREVDVSSYADRVGYFFGVARNVVHEEHRSALRESKALESFLREISRTPADPDAWKQAEAAQSCLEHCVATLPDHARQLILRYYSNQGAAKVTAHRALADELGKSVNALRIEAHRIRKTLEQCVFGCLHEAVS